MVISYHARKQKSRGQTLHLCCICITCQIHEYIFIVAKKKTLSASINYYFQNL